MMNNTITPRTLKPFTVVITPKMEAHCGSYRNGVVTIQVRAYDRNSALKKARDYYRLEMGEGGPNGIPATFRATVGTIDNDF